MIETVCDVPMSRLLLEPDSVRPVTLARRSAFG
jgi:hypothetical protein